MSSESLINNALGLAQKVRQKMSKLKVRVHMGGGNLKKQFKKADMSGAKWALLVGDEELEQNLVTIKDLRDSATGQMTVPLEEAMQKIIANNG